MITQKKMFHVFTTQLLSSYFAREEMSLFYTEQKHKNVMRKSDGMKVHDAVRVKKWEELGSNKQWGNKDS